MIKRHILLVSIVCLVLVSCASQPPIIISDENQVRKIAEAAVMKREKWPDPALSNSNQKFISTADVAVMQREGYPHSLLSNSNDGFISQAIQGKNGKWWVVVHKMVGEGIYVPKTGRLLTLSPSGKVIHYKTISDGPGEIGNTGYGY